MLTIDMLTEKVKKRFLAKVRKVEGGCWLWTGGHNASGYGTTKIKANSYLAHRVSWTIHRGEIPEGLFVCHHCDNPPCVNPDHFFLGTKKDNTQDSIAKGRWMTEERARAFAEAKANGKLGKAKGDRNGSRLHPERLKRGLDSPRAKLTAIGVMRIRERHAVGDTNWSQLSREFGMTREAIKNIVHRKSYQDVA
jgi:hypothetical protein